MPPPVMSDAQFTRTIPINLYLQLPNEETNEVIRSFKAKFIDVQKYQQAVN